MNRPNQPQTDEQREAMNIIQRRVAALEASLRLPAGKLREAGDVIADARAIEAFLRGDEVSQ